MEGMKITVREKTIPSSFGLWGSKRTEAPGCFWEVDHASEEH